MKPGTGYKIYLTIFLLSLTIGCTKNYKPPNLGELYTRSAQEFHKYGNPVIVIPGILGSTLKEKDTGQIVWGAFDRDFANPETPEGARLIALPLDKNSSSDNVVAAGALERVKVSLLGLPLQLNAYVNILSTLGAGGFQDDSFKLEDVDYGTEHFTCFQFAYDWRLDNVENAKRLHTFILEKKMYVEQELEKRYGIKREIKFDIVAHSMGGLIARYYMMYGDTDLDEIVDTEGPSWKGAELVENVIIIGTPNAGSVNVVDDLFHGKDIGPFLPTYQSSIIGSMPSTYQLLTRTRHKHVVDQNGVVLDLFDPKVWEKYNFGLMNPDQEYMLEILLPDVKDKDERKEIAYDYLTYSLDRAKRFQNALDKQSEPPDTVKFYLMAGDSVATPATYKVNTDTGKIVEITTSHGDGTVTRASAVMDERAGNVEWTPYIQSPIKWTNVMFLFSDHLGITKDPTFSDNILFILLENPANYKLPKES